MSNFNLHLVWSFCKLQACERTRGGGLQGFLHRFSRLRRGGRGIPIFLARIVGEWMAWGEHGLKASGQRVQYLLSYEQVQIECTSTLVLLSCWSDFQYSLCGKMKLETQ